MACFGAYFAHAQICNVTRATKWFSSSFPNYKVPIQYCPSTTPVQLRTTKYYSVIQSTTPVLLCTTQYYSNTTPYQKVLLQRPAGRWTQYWPAGRDTWKRPAGRRETAGRPAGDEIANKSPVLSIVKMDFQSITYQMLKCIIQGPFSYNIKLKPPILSKYRYLMLVFWYLAVLSKLYLNFFHTLLAVHLIF